MLGLQVVQDAPTVLEIFNSLFAVARWDHCMKTRFLLHLIILV